jgi:hypothetical protein
VGILRNVNCRQPYAGEYQCRLHSNQSRALVVNDRHARITDCSQRSTRQKIASCTISRSPARVLGTSRRSRTLFQRLRLVHTVYSTPRLFAANPNGAPPTARSPLAQCLRTIPPPQRLLPVPRIRRTRPSQRSTSKSSYPRPLSHVTISPAFAHR